MTAVDPTLAPRPNEESRAYAARMRYVVMGETRSLARLSQELGKSVGLLQRWCAQFAWVECARAYDQQLAHRAAQVHQEAYLAAVEEHRTRYGDCGKALYGVAVRCLSELQSQQGHMEFTPASLLTIARAVVVAADLEAHSLRLAELLPKLGRTNNAEG